MRGCQFCLYPVGIVRVRVSWFLQGLELVNSSADLRPGLWPPLSCLQAGFSILLELVAVVAVGFKIADEI